MHRKGLDVAMLVPPEISSINRHVSSQTRRDTKWSPESADRIFQVFSIVREMIEEAASDVGIETDIEEFPLYYSPMDNFVVGRDRAVAIAKSDITVLVDPSDREIVYATTITWNELRRTVIAFSDQETLEERFDVMGTLKLPLALAVSDATKTHMLNRVFPYCISSNEEDRAKKHHTNMTVIRHAFLYPNNPALEVDRSRSQLFIPSSQ